MCWLAPPILASPCNPPSPLRAMPVWKQHISIRGFPKLGEAIRGNRNSAFASILEALQVDYLKYLFI